MRRQRGEARQPRVAPGRPDVPDFIAVAGGTTSIYRQIGIGGEHLFRQVLQDALGFTAEQAAC